MKTVYSKYNSHRAPEFRVRTSIVTDGNKKFVKKSPLTKDAMPHISGMPKNKEALESLYKRVTPVGCSLTEKEISFEFIRGERLDKDVDYLSDEPGVIKEKILRIFDVIFDFNEDKVKDGYVCPANIDTIISNFAKTDTGVYLYDYEWVEYEPVPVNFLKYRAVIYCYYENAEKLSGRFSLTEFILLFGFTKRQTEIFHEMEECFQEYVHGKNRKFMISVKYEKPITPYEDKIITLENTLINLNNVNTGLKERVELGLREIDEKNKAIETKDDEIDKLRHTIHDNNLKIGELNNILGKKNELIGNIKRSIKNPFFGVKFACGVLVKRMFRKKPRTGEYLINLEKEITGDYDYWVRKKEEKISGHSGRALPKINVLMVDCGVGDEALSLTMESLKGQNYPGISLCTVKPDGAGLNEAIEKAGGEYVGFIEAGDTLGAGALMKYGEIIGAGGDNGDASVVAIYCDEDTLGSDGVRRNPYFKPDFAPDTLGSVDYMSRFFLCRKDVLEAIGGFSTDKKSLMYDLTLRVYEYCKEKCGERPEEINGVIKHVDVPFYHRRENLEGPTVYGILPEEFDGAVKVSGTNGIRRILPVTGEPLVSIVIPSKDNPKIFDTLIYSLRTHTEYKNYEVILVDNGSSEENKAKYEDICNRYEVNYLYRPMEFNFSKMCNMGAAAGSGEYLLFLNDDMEVTGGEWLTRMLGAAASDGAGAVGAKLLFPGGEVIQHIGVVNGVSGPSHVHARLQDKDTFPEYKNLLDTNVICVTAACLLVARSKYDEVGGFDEELKVAYNDVDFCFKLYEKGYYNIQRNDAVLIHHESLSRGQDVEDKGKLNRLLREKDKLYERHPALFRYDPFYSKNYDSFYAYYPVNLDGDYDYYVRPAKDYPVGDITKFHYHFDTVAVTWGVHILGWTAFEEEDNTEPISMLFKNKADGSILELNLRRRKVEDLGIIMPYVPYSWFGGFRLMAERDRVPPGVYEVGFLFLGKKYPTDMEIEIDDYKAS